MDRESRMIASGRRSRARGAVLVFTVLAGALGLLPLAGCGDGGSGDDVARRRESVRMELDVLPGAIYDPPKPAPALRLAGGGDGGGGGTYDLASERGRVVLLFFGFTECPDVCPITMKRWAQVRSELGADTSRVRFVFVSVDPEHDTSEAAAAYARKFHPAFVGLSGTVAEIDEIALAWSVSKGRAHTGQVFVVNPEGLIPWGYGTSATVPEIVRGIRALARAPSAS